MALQIHQADAEMLTAEESLRMGTGCGFQFVSSRRRLASIEVWGRTDSAMRSFCNGNSQKFDPSVSLVDNEPSFSRLVLGRFLGDREVR